LAHLQEKYPQNEFALIMGEDNLNSLQKWKNHEVILQNHELYVYPRITSEPQPKPGFLENFKAKIHTIDAPIVEISSTFIRNAIKGKKNINPMLPAKVADYIEHNLFYTK
jgi:nicotinate-nucleotide adenylyltransferase